MLIATYRILNPGDADFAEENACDINALRSLHAGEVSRFDLLVPKARPAIGDGKFGRGLWAFVSVFLPVALHFGSFGLWQLWTLAALGFWRLGFSGRFMRKGAEYILKVRPRSAFAAALLVTALAAATQEILVLFGSTLCFATFFPAILIAGLLGGAAAGAFATAVTIPIVWWAFMPPYFEFNPLTRTDYDQITIFLLCSSLLICFSQLYREALVLSRK